MKQLLFPSKGFIRVAAASALLLWLLIALITPKLTAFAELPPRPEGTTETADTTLKGGQIQLTVTDPSGGEWTAIEWQDSNTGKWHLVDGWRGDLNSAGTQSWWVGRNQLGRGPFRWLVYDSKGGKLLTTSAEFDMPPHNETSTLVTVTLTE